jgi:putative acetyltransferase
MKLIRCTSENNDFRMLTSFLDKDLNSRYGVLQTHYDQFNKIEAIDTVVVAYLEDNPVGCGCFKKYDEVSVEIKRMFVKSEFRGKGIARMILTELEKWATEDGYARSVLETGIKQFEAINFYTNIGYTRIENFGQYAGNSNSICMSKTLQNWNKE